MNATELIEYTRFILAEPTANLWEDAEILNYLNRSYEQLYRMSANKDRGYGLVVFDWTSSVFGTPTLRKPGEYAIRVPHNFFHIAAIEDATKQYERINMGYRDSDDSRSWYFSGSNEILIRDTVAPSSLRFLVYQSPTELSIGTFSGISSQTGVLTATTGTVSQDPWAYAESRIEVTSGTGIGSMLYVTAYDRTTKTVTWTNPGGVDPSNTDAYAMVPDIDDLHHELLAYEAANRAFTKEGNTNGKGVVQDVLAELRREFINSLTPRGYSGPRTVQSRNRSRRSNTYDYSPNL